MVLIGTSPGPGDVPLFGVTAEPGLGIVVDDGFGTAIVLSLMCDARASEADVVERPELAKGRRGWCLEDADDPFGSRLWVLSRAKLTEATLREAEQMARESLAWMVRERIADGIEVVGIRDGEKLCLRVRVRRGRERRWAHRWERTLSGDYDLGRFEMQLEVV